MAILLGDLALVLADTLVRDAPADARDVFDQLRLEVNAGQLLDLFATAANAATVEQARTIAEYKSGRYTVERPLHLGAAVAGGLAAVAASLTAYARPTGVAFQLQDDLLGAFGGDEQLGKPVGDDFRQGKPTALFAMARQRATGADAETLARHYGRPALDDAGVRAIQHVFETTGARAAVEELVASLVAEAVEALAQAPITTPARRALEDLARFVGVRQH